MTELKNEQINKGKLMNALRYILVSLHPTASIFLVFQEYITVVFDIKSPHGYSYLTIFNGIHSISDVFEILYLGVLCFPMTLIFHLPGILSIFFCVRCMMKKQINLTYGFIIIIVSIISLLWFSWVIASGV